MKYVRVFSFTLLSLLLLSLYVHAAEDSDETASETTQVKEDVNSGMITQSSPIVGYQPLTVAGQEIEATYLEETLGERYGAIIFLHDHGNTLEDQGVVTPLRHQMPQYGWSTLTIALDYPFEPVILLSPTMENVSEAEPAQADMAEKESSETTKEKAALPPISNQQRLEAAIAFLQTKEVDRIIYIGHGLGGNLAVELLDTETTPIQALVLVGTPALTTDEVFKTMQHPILELYGDNDLSGVVEAVQQRKVIMKRTGNSRYATREVIGADHFFTGLQATLVSTLRGWLKITFIDEKKTN